VRTDIILLAEECRKGGIGICLEDDGFGVNGGIWGWLVGGALLIGCLTYAVILFVRAWHDS
jgi:hypothetical protein